MLCPHYSLWKVIAKPHWTARGLQLYLSIHIPVCYTHMIFTKLVLQKQCESCNRNTQRSTSNFLTQVTCSNIWYLQKLVQDIHTAQSALCLNFNTGLEVAVEMTCETDLQHNPAVLCSPRCPLRGFSTLGGRQGRSSPGDVQQPEPCPSVSSANELSQSFLTLTVRQKLMSCTG